MTYFVLLFYYMLHFSCVLVRLIADLYIAPYFIECIINTGSANPLLSLTVF